MTPPKDAQESNLPGRPQQFDLETRSKRAFTSALPSTWEDRERTGREYGIDYDIEVFRDGHPAGLDFCVQLKSTERLRGAPSTSIKWRTFNYWRLVKRPVLVLIWEASTDRLWWQWSHKFDPYGLDPTSETFSFGFPDEQVWDRLVTPNLIERELDAWHAWQAPESHLPVHITLNGEGEYAGIDVGRFLGALRLAFQRFTDILEVRRDPQSLLNMSIEISSDRSVIWLSGGPSLTYHHEPSTEVSEPEIEEFVRAIVADIMVMVSLGLTRFNLSPGSARLLVEAVEKSRVALTPLIGADLLSLLFAHGQLSGGLDLANRMLDNIDPLARVAAMESLARANPGWTATQRAEIVESLLRRAEVDIAAGREVDASVLTYNAAHFLFDSDLGESLHLLDRAAELNPYYRERGYWWRERGGALFLGGGYSEAASHYRRAYDLGDRRALPLLADSLLFSGDFRAALNTLKSAIGDEALNTPEWELKYRVFTRLVEWTEIERQERRPDDATAIVAGQSDVIELRSALDVDMLCGEALFQLAHLRESEDDLKTVLMVASALVHPLDPLPIPWLRSIATAAETESDLLQAVAMCAKRFSGTEILAMLSETSEASEALSWIEGLFDSLPDYPQPPSELRFTDPESPTFHAIDVDRR